MLNYLYVQNYRLFPYRLFRKRRFQICGFLVVLTIFVCAVAYQYSFKIGYMIGVIPEMGPFTYPDFNEGIWKERVLSFVKDWAGRQSACRKERSTRGFAKLWPCMDDGDDRIMEQFHFVPPDLNKITINRTKLKKILLHIETSLLLTTSAGQWMFLKDECPVNTCTITTDRQEFQNADAIIFTDGFKMPAHQRRDLNQIWLLYLIEPPHHTQPFPYNQVFNWTATYRTDSDLTVAFDKFVPYYSGVLSKPQEINFAAKKSRKVAWVVSNCRSSNSRMQYATELGKHIEVDIYGKCAVDSSHACPDGDSCFRYIGQRYKFYLSFENSNCRDYISEKFFFNALRNDIVPIVMGARKQDYERVAPYHSFIYVEDFDSPKALAEYLHKLDANDELYNEYFKWKGTGKFIYDGHFWCRLCAMLHSNFTPKTYDNMDAWWRGPGICAKNTWKEEFKEFNDEMLSYWKTNVLSQGQRYWILKGAPYFGISKYRKFRHFKNLGIS